MVNRDMGKDLLVIGASSDMGIETIREIHPDYDVIIAHYHHMNTRLESLKEELGERLVCVPADLSNETDTKNLIETICKMAIVPSHIIHFPAAPIQTRKFHKLSWDVIQKELDISLRSIVLILQEFLPRLTKRNEGRVILMLSMVVNGMPPKYNSDYVVVKYSLLGLVRSLAIEYADKGITINGISPALVQTKFVNNMHAFQIEQNAQLSPAGKNLETADVIPTIKFLLSSGASAINGQNICITYGR